MIKIKTLHPEISEVERLIDSKSVEYFQDGEYKTAQIFKALDSDFFEYRDKNGFARYYEMAAEAEKPEEFAQGERDIRPEKQA